MKKRTGPIKIEYFCDGCSQMQQYQGGSVGCKETGESLYGLSSSITFSKYKTPNAIPTPESCPYLLKKLRKDKLEKINDS